jgi:hypothetical protein
VTEQLPRAKSPHKRQVYSIPPSPLEFVTVSGPRGVEDVSLVQSPID